MENILLFYRVLKNIPGGCLGFLPSTVVDYLFGAVGGFVLGLKQSKLNLWGLNVL